MFALALVVGITTGAGVWIFKGLIEIAHHLFFDVLGGALSPLGGWTVLLVPAIGGLVVGVLMYLVRRRRAASRRGGDHGSGGVSRRTTAL